MWEWLSNFFTATVDWFTGLSWVKAIICGFKAVVAAVKKWFSPGIARRKAEAAKIEAQAKADAVKIKAEAEAEAAKIRAQTEADVRVIEARGIIEVDDMLQNGDRLTAWQQRNTKSIVHKAEKMEPGGAQKFRNMNKGWVADYLDNCKNDSDEEMQSLWAKILAGEADKPGSFSKSTVDAVGKLSKEDALMFNDFCQFVWNDNLSQGEGVPLIYDWLADVYEGRVFNAAEHLDYLRLVSCKGIGSNIGVFNTPSILMSYQGDFVRLDISPEKSGKSAGKSLLDLGHVQFTEAGRQLYRICEVSKNDAFFKHTLERWQQKGYNPVVQEKGAGE